MAAAWAAGTPVPEGGYDSLTAPELRRLCSERGLSNEGFKRNLVMRLEGHDRGQGNGAGGALPQSDDAHLQAILAELGERRPRKLLPTPPAKPPPPKPSQPPVQGLPHAAMFHGAPPLVPAAPPGVPSKAGPQEVAFEDPVRPQPLQARPTAVKSRQPAPELQQQQQPIAKVPLVSKASLKAAHLLGGGGGAAAAAAAAEGGPATTTIPGACAKHLALGGGPPPSSAAAGAAAGPPGAMAKQQVQPQLAMPIGARAKVAQPQQQPGSLVAKRPPPVQPAPELVSQGHVPMAGLAGGGAPPAAADAEAAMSLPPPASRKRPAPDAAAPLPAQPVVEEEPPRLAGRELRQRVEEVTEAAFAVSRLLARREALASQLEEVRQVVERKGTERQKLQERLQALGDEQNRHREGLRDQACRRLEFAQQPERAAGVVSKARPLRSS